MFLLFKICNNNKQFLNISFILCLRKNYLLQIKDYKILYCLINLTYKIYKLKENCNNCKFKNINLNANVILKIEVR